MKKFVTGIFTAAALLGASPLFGDEPSLFERLDKNKDGFLSGDEVGDEHKALFERMVRVADKDSDKKLSKDEFAAGQSQKEEKRPTFGGPGGGGPGRGAGMRPEEVFALFDKNKDGKLTPDEAPDRMKEHFSKIDQNADGVIDAKELELALGALRQMGASADPRFLDRMFSERDANKDGKLTASEVPEERREMFTRILKSTGKDPEAGLTKEEMAKFIEKMTKGPRNQEEGEERAQQERRREERGPEGRGPRPDGPPREGRPEGDRRPDGDRRPEGDRPRDGERRPEGRPEGDRSPDRRPTADHRPNGPGPHGPGPGMHHHLPPVFARWTPIMMAALPKKNSKPLPFTFANSTEMTMVR